MLVLFLFLMTVFGTFVLTYDQMEIVYKELYRLIRKLLDSFKGVELTDKGEVWERVRVVLGITMGMGTDRAVRAFFAVSVSLSLATVVLLGTKVSLRLTCAASVMTAFIPYILLLVRMSRLRIRSSHEGEVLLAEITENYKIYYYNMREAIDRTASGIEDAPGSKKILLNLSRGLGRAGSERSIMRLLEEFSLSINTSWANTLKNLMYFSLVHGIRVDEALEDLTLTIRKAREVEEFSRRENNESNLMIRYLVPFTYILTVVGGVRFFGLGWQKFLHYQFETGVGLTWLTIFLLVYAISYIVNSYLSVSKLDL